MTVLVHQGDCLDVLRSMPDNSIDSIVTDPPAGIAFMNAHWDRDKGGREAWIAWMTEVATECLRVIKPGGHALVWSIPRTSHWTGTAWEQAGWQPRDKVYHAFGSGFPKSLDVSKAIDKAAGAEREKVPATGGLHKNRNLNDDGWSKIGDDNALMDSDVPATDEARQWSGWGTALKPALEPITVARKPLEGTVAANVLQWGTGALNIDGCRVGDENGRWPANLVHDGSDEVTQPLGHAERFFYVAKAGRRERDAGLDDSTTAMRNDGRLTEIDNPYQRGRVLRNHHATVKPIALMEYLITLVTPRGGIVLDPFAGSGTTGCAAARLGFDAVLIEREAEYVEIARRRVAYWSADLVIQN